MIIAADTVTLKKYVYVFCINTFVQMNFVAFKLGAEENIWSEEG
jgi:hypothetical protein